MRVQRRRQYKVVAQEHPMGCAVACVASRLGISYARALKLFEHPEHAWTKGYYCEEIVRALAAEHLHYTFARYDQERHSKILKHAGTIAFIDPCSRYPSGHFVIRSGRSGQNLWMNPWRNFPRMTPVLAGFERKPPGKLGYVLFESSPVQ